MTGVNHGSAFRFKRYAINHELRHGLSSLFEKLAYGYRIPNIPRLAAIQATYEPYGYAAKPVQGASYSPLRSSISLGKESITPYMLPLLAANMISDAAQNHVAVSISYAADIALLALGGATAAVIRSKRF